MKKQDWLFDIIHTMSTPEKGFFVKYCNLFSEGESGYMVLYKILERMKVYDEKELKKKIQGKIPATRLPATRNYLKNMLLKSLQIFNDEQSDELILNSMLFNISFYHRKNLFALCEKEVAAARKFAEQHELHTRLHEIMRWERTIIPVMNPLDAETFRRLEKGIEDEKRNFIRIETDASYYLRTIRLNKLIHRTGRTLNEPIEKTKAFADFCSDSYYTDESLAQTTASRIMYCTMQFVTAYHRKDMERVDYFLKRRIELMEANPYFLLNRLATYISTLYNYIIFISLKKDIKLFQEQMNKFTAIPEVYKKRADKFHIETIHVHSINAWLDFYIITGDFKKITEMTIAFPVAYSKTNYLLTFYYSACLKAATGYFAVGDYKTALRFINRIIQDNSSKSFPECLMLSRIMNLMIHYEMKNDSAIDYERHSINYFLKKGENPAKLEQEVLNFIRELQRNDLQGGKEKLTAIRENIRAIASPADDQRNFFIFTWLDAKTNGISFTAAYQHGLK